MQKIGISRMADRRFSIYIGRGHYIDHVQLALLDNIRRQPSILDLEDLYDYFDINELDKFDFLVNTKLIKIEKIGKLPKMTIFCNGEFYYGERGINMKMKVTKKAMKLLEKLKRDELFTECRKLADEEVINKAIKNAISHNGEIYYGERGVDMKKEKNNDKMY